jgi:hypothetical protein
MRKANRSIGTSRSSGARGRHELDTARLRERLIALTRDLVLIPGSEERPHDLRRAVEWVRNHLESLESVEVRS